MSPEIQAQDPTADAPATPKPRRRRRKPAAPDAG